MKVILLVFFAGTLQAQPPAAFEAATVKLNTSGGQGSSIRMRSSQVTIENRSLSGLIQLAYGLQEYAYSGPPWSNSVFFDVVAKLPEGARQWTAMLQPLLADRFRLAVHWEEREVNGFGLTVDKQHLQIKPVEPGPGGVGHGSSMVQITKGKMADFARELSAALQRPVEDNTGLTESYDIRIRWLPDGFTGSESMNTSSSVYEAVQDLGLRLQVRKVRVQVLVVDHTERAPSEN
jgi:uncharacterized protein (TIGR03435 family)